MELILCQIDINDYYNLCLVTVFQLSEYSLFFPVLFWFFLIKLNHIHCHLIELYKKNFYLQYYCQTGNQKIPFHISISRYEILNFFFFVRLIFLILLYWYFDLSNCYTFIFKISFIL